MTHQEIKNKIKDLESGLTGDLAKDSELSYKIYKLRKKLPENEVQDMDYDNNGDCLMCGS